MDMTKEQVCDCGAVSGREEESGALAPTDLTQIDLRQQLLVPEPLNKEAYLAMKSKTVARLGIWRTGGRYLTEPSLRFRADHAAAQNAVFTNVDEKFLKDWGLLEVVTRCRDKDHYLTRPDLGRQLTELSGELLKNHCRLQPTVQVYIADGLSSTAVECNAKDVYLALEQGLQDDGIDLGTPFFLRYGRVAAMEPIAEILQPQVVAVLIGERPGLATAESLSCYMAYRPTVGMPEARRTVISNIHDEGTPALEAGAHIADVIKKMLEQKTSGIELKK